jgi:2,3-bisphosphoglycerate-dependent phosphoglycerate mutase
MLRGWQTAVELADALGRSSGAIESFDALAERSVGSAANLSIRQIEAILRQDPRFPAPPSGWKSDSHYCLPLQGAESLMTAGQRVAAHLQERMEQLAGVVERDTLKLFVGHGAAFRHAAYHLGVLQFEQLARFSMFHGRPVYIECRVGEGWRHVAGEWKLRGEKVQEID